MPTCVSPPRACRVGFLFVFFSLLVPYFASPLSAAITTELGSDDPRLITASAVTSFDSIGTSLEGAVVDVRYADGSADSAVFVGDASTPGAAAATGADWRLSLTERTNFSNPWTFENLSTGTATMANTIDQICVFAVPGGEGFDLDDSRVGGTTGTPGSSNGFEFSFVGSTGISLDTFDQHVRYDLPITVAGEPHVIDLWGRMCVNVTRNDDNPIAGVGPSQDFNFIQDTDTLIDPVRILVPEPDSRWGMIIAMALFGCVTHRRR